MRHTNRHRRPLRFSELEMGDGGIARRQKRLQRRRDRLHRLGKTDTDRFQRIDARLNDIALGGRGQTALGAGIRGGIGQFGDMLAKAAPIVGSIVPGAGTAIGSAAGGLFGNFLGGLNDDIPVPGQTQPQFAQPNLGIQGFDQILGQTPFGSGFGDIFGGGQNPFGSIFGGMLGGGQNPFGGTPGFMGTQTQFNPFQMLSALGGLSNLFGSLSGGQDFLAKDGGKRMKKPAKGNLMYQSGGQVQQPQPQLVDIQAEKGELIFHPTGMLSDVHAKKSHSKMNKKGDDDIVTDHPLDGSFIFSDFLRVNKKDAEEMVVGIKRYPYDENKKGKEPELYTLGDLFGKKERKQSPAKLANRIKKNFKVTGNKKDVFDMFGDELNFKNRIPYLQGISMLSEVERMKDDMEEQAKENQEVILAKKGGKMRSRRVRKAQVGVPNPYDPFINQPNIPFLPAHRLLVGTQFDPSSIGINPVNTQVDPFNFRDQIIADNQPVAGGQFDDLMRFMQGAANPRDYSRVISPIAPGTDLFPLTDPETGEVIRSAAPNPVSSSNQGAGQGAGQVLTNFVDQGNPLLRTLGQAGMLGGAGINLGANVAGAIGSYGLYNKLLRENPEFFQGQRDLANRGRDIASTGSLFDVGLGLLKQGPEDLPIDRASRLRQFNPFRGVGDVRRLADQSLGQINTLFRNNPQFAGRNVGQAIAANNQSIAQAYRDARNQELGIGRELDITDFKNANILAGNRQRRSDFGNALIDQSRQGIGNFFINESSRPFDELGLNLSERQTEQLLREQRLLQPVQFASSAGNSLANLGAAAYGLGTNFLPQQQVVGPDGQVIGGEGGGALGFLPDIIDIISGDPDKRANRRDRRVNRKANRKTRRANRRKRK